MAIRIVRLVLLLFLIAVPAAAQEAISFEEFAKRVDPFFAEELIADVRQALPQTSFDVWGYDVGDYSGDGANDLALTLRPRNDSRRRVTVFYFIDDEGTLRLVREAVEPFVELPIEVGVGIRDGNVYTIHKEKEFEWIAIGHRFRDGVLMMVDRFVTRRVGGYTHETFRNFQTLEGFERYLNVVNEELVFRSDFLTLPSYRRGRDISSGYQATATAHHSKYVSRGAYFWSAERDGAIDMRSAFDDEYLYFHLQVDDDEVINLPVNGVDTTADRLEVWLDMYALGDRFRSSSRRQRDFRMTVDSNIYALELPLGDLVDLQPRIKTSNVLDDVQAGAVKRVRAVAARNDSGYSVKIRIPFTLLGFDAAPLEEGQLTEFGATVVVHDVDNPYRPEQVTTISTSEKFDPTKPATFGSIVLIPETLHYGESVNIFVGELKERLEEVGY